jgi:hypothetical protein
LLSITTPYRDHGRVGGWCIESIPERPKVTSARDGLGKATFG